MAYFDENNRLQEQTADLVVVCCGVNETARLLLNSKSKIFPNGIGNNNDWVGRNLVGHAYTGASGLLPGGACDDAGPGASCSICHLRSSNCGMDLAKLNAAVRAPSRFDIHTVTCKDCHPKGVPRRRNGLRRARAAGD